MLTAPILNEQRLLGVVVGRHLVPSLYKSKHPPIFKRHDLPTWSTMCLYVLSSLVSSAV
jgi:hypothetical protein